MKSGLCMKRIFKTRTVEVSRNIMEFANERH